LNGKSKIALATAIGNGRLDVLMSRRQGLAHFVRPNPPGKTLL